MCQFLTVISFKLLLLAIALVPFELLACFGLFINPRLLVTIRLFHCSLRIFETHFLSQNVGKRACLVLLDPF